MPAARDSEPVPAETPPPRAPAVAPGRAPGGAADTFGRRFASAAAHHDGPFRPAPVVLARAFADALLRRRRTPTPSNDGAPSVSGEPAGAPAPRPGGARRPDPSAAPALPTWAARLTGSGSSARVGLTVVVGVAAALTGLSAIPDSLAADPAAGPTGPTASWRPAAHMSDPAPASADAAPPAGAEGARPRPTTLTIGDAVDVATLAARTPLDARLAARLEAVHRRPPVPPGLPVGSPVRTGLVSSSFGPRRHPVSGRVRAHAGTDFAVPTGTPVFSTADGRVRASSRRTGYGLTIEVDHRDPAGLRTSTLYAHLSASAVRPGAPVRRGALLGWSGGGAPGDGVSTGPHLHYEVRVGGRPESPTVVDARVRAWRADTVRRLRAVVAEARALEGRPPVDAPPSAR